MNHDTNTQHKDIFSGEKFTIPTFKEGKLAFQGIRFDVRTVKVPGRSDTTIERDVVVHPGAVIILPILNKSEIVMIRNQRFAVGKKLWELPAGTLDTNESPIDTAKRELIEETGYEAKFVEPLTAFYTTPGICNEAMYAFVAKDLSFVGQALEESERIVTEIVTWKEALNMIKSGVIQDGKTIATLLFYEAFRK